MKPTQFKDFIKTVKRNLASFLVIAVLFGAAIAMFCGGGWCCVSNQELVNSALTEGRNHLVEYTFPYGIGDGSVTELADPYGIGKYSADLKAEGYYHACRMFDLGGTRYQAKIMSLMKEIDVPLSLEGELPKTDGEIALRAYWAKDNGVSIGDTITFAKGSGDGLKSSEFKVTALLENSPYLTARETANGTSDLNSLPINTVMYVVPEAFDGSYGFGITNVCVLSENLNTGDVYDDEYLQLEDSVVKGLADAAERLYRKGYDAAIYKMSFLPPEARTEIKDCGYYTQVRSDNVGTVITALMQNIFDKVRVSLTALFVVVSLFVAYSIISRMVYDHIKLIGTKVANGMTKWEVFKLYLAFCMGALAVGAVISLGIIWIYETVIRIALSTTIVYQHQSFYFGWGEYLIIIGILALFALFVTYISVGKIVRMNVTRQLAGEVPTAGKSRFYEHFGIWKKLPLISKTVVNNLFNDKRRVVGTILGVVGSAALIIASFSFSNLVLDSYNAQFKDYYHFDSIVRYAPESSGIIRNVLDRNKCITTPVFAEDLYAESESGELTLTTLYVYSDAESFSKLVTLEIDGERGIRKGFYISHAFEREYDLQSGYTQQICFDDGSKTEVTVDGFFTDYLFEGVAFCDVETFKERFGYEPSKNAFLVDASSVKPEVLASELMECKGYFTTTDYYAQSEEAFEIIRYVMLMMRLVFLTVAIGMAFMVMYNLINVYITEKKRDLITMMINGYETRFAKKYIYCDTIALSVIGVIIGAVVGQFFGNFTAESFASAECRFMNGVDLLGILWGALIMAAILAVICWFSLRRIDKFKLSDLNA